MPLLRIPHFVTFICLFFFLIYCNGFPRACIQIQFVTFGSEIPWACRCRRNCTVEIPARLFDTKFLTSLDLAAILFFITTFLQSFLHRLCAALRAEKADVEQTKKRWFHSSRVMFHFGSQFVLSNNQSRATLWVLETCLSVGRLPLMIILITASLSSKMYNIAPFCDRIVVGQSAYLIIRGSAHCTSPQTNPHGR